MTRDGCLSCAYHAKMFGCLSCPALPAESCFASVPLASVFKVNLPHVLVTCDFLDTEAGWLTELIFDRNLWKKSSSPACLSAKVTPTKLKKVKMVRETSNTSSSELSVLSRPKFKLGRTIFDSSTSSSNESIPVFKSSDRDQIELNSERISEEIVMVHCEFYKMNADRWVLNIICDVNKSYSYWLKILVS